MPKIGVLYAVYYPVKQGILNFEPFFTQHIF